MYTLIHIYLYIYIYIYICIHIHVGTDALPWTCLEYIKLNESDTTSSSRIFIKVLVQELSESLGLAMLRERYSDPYMQVTGHLLLFLLITLYLYLYGWYGKYLAIFVVIYQSKHDLY
jgi:hypothetical protein